MAAFRPDREGPGSDGKAWCEQCQHRVTAAGAAACKRNFCSFKDGHEAVPTKRRGPVPGSITRKLGRRPLGEPKGKLTRKQKEMLNHLFNRAARDGTVTASNNDLGKVFGISSTSAASLIRALEREREIVVVSNSGGNRKKTYRVTKIAVTAQPIEQLLAPGDEACTRCRFSHFTSGGAFVCRRKPPLGQVGFPQIQPTDWCGEFNPIQKT